MNLWLDKSLKHRFLLAHLLLCAVIVAVYYPVMTDGIHTMDDPGIISLYSTSPPLSQVLIPGQGYYYRPLVELSFWLDNLLWGMQPSVMHLENVLLHVANAMLVFLLARRICGRYQGTHPLLPLFAALLFALHPLNVEAVGWIAGRTDPLLSLFALCACAFWLKWLDEQGWVPLSLAVLFLAGAVLTKEVGLALIPVALVFAFSRSAAPLAVLRRNLVNAAAVTSLIGLLLMLLVLFLRGSSLAVSRLLAPGEGVAPDTALKVLAALGFYCKKMFLPLPLNFAITEIPAPYAFLGAGTVLLSLLALWKRREPAALFIAAAIMVLPALVLVLRQISWTPVAERYLYLPTAFLSLGICNVLALQRQSVLVKVAPFLVLLLLVAALASRQRNVLWQDKLLFFQDAVAKSPGFSALYNELGTLQLRDGRVAEAAQAFATAERLNKRPSTAYVIKGNIMATIIAKGDFSGARSYFFKLFPDKREAPPLFLEMLQEADGKRLTSMSGAERDALARDMIGTMGLLHERSGEFFWLYQSGKLAVTLKSYPEASAFFRRVYRDAPPDAHYRLATQKQLQNLGTLP